MQVSSDEEQLYERGGRRPPEVPPEPAPAPARHIVPVEEKGKPQLGPFSSAGPSLPLQ